MTVLAELARLRITFQTNFARTQREMNKLQDSLISATVRANILSKSMNTGFSNSIEPLNQLSTQLSKWMSKQEAATKKALAFNSALSKVAKAAGAIYLARAAIRAIVGPLAEAARSAGKLEDGFLFVERMQRSLKGSGFRDATLELAQSLKRIDITQLQKVEEISARLGLRGSDQILQFSKTISQLALVTQSSASNLANDIGKMINVFGFEDVIQSSKDLGNALLALESNFVVMAPEIANISQRLAGFAKNAGFAAVEVLALATFGKTLGQRTEVTASAFTRAFQGIFSNLNDVARALGKTHKEGLLFARAFDENPFEAFMMFLKEFKSYDFGRQEAVLKAMEATGFRVGPVIRVMADNWQVAFEAMEVANKAIDEGTEILDQYGVVAGGIVGKMEDMKEQWFLFKAAIGKNDFILNAIGAITTAIETLHKALKAYREYKMGGYQTDIGRGGVDTGKINFKSQADVFGRDVAFTAVSMFGSYEGPLPSKQHSRSSAHRGYNEMAQKEVAIWADEAVKIKEASEKFEAFGISLREFKSYDIGRQETVLKAMEAMGFRVDYDKNWQLPDEDTEITQKEKDRLHAEHTWINELKRMALAEARKNADEIARIKVAAAKKAERKEASRKESNRRFEISEEFRGRREALNKQFSDFKRSTGRLGGSFSGQGLTDELQKRSQESKMDKQLDKLEKIRDIEEKALRVAKQIRDNPKAAVVGP